MAGDVVGIGGRLPPGRAVEASGEPREDLDRGMIQSGSCLNRIILAFVLRED